MYSVNFILLLSSHTCTLRSTQPTQTHHTNMHHIHTHPDQGHKPCKSPSSHSQFRYHFAICTHYKYKYITKAHPRSHVQLLPQQTQLFFSQLQRPMRQKKKKRTSSHPFQKCKGRTLEGGTGDEWGI